MTDRWTPSEFKYIKKLCSFCLWAHLHHIARGSCSMVSAGPCIFDRWRVFYQITSYPCLSHNAEITYVLIHFFRSVGKCLDSSLTLRFLPRFFTLKVYLQLDPPLLLTARVWCTPVRSCTNLGAVPKELYLYLQGVPVLRFWRSFAVYDHPLRAWCEKCYAGTAHPSGRKGAK